MDKDGVLAWLERRGIRRIVEGMARYGIQTELRAFGVSMGTLLSLRKQLGKDHDLAMAGFQPADGRQVGNLPPQQRSHHKEALPWWSFALFGGLLTVWLGQKLLEIAGLQLLSEDGQSSILNLQSAILFLAGAVAGGALGWFIIGPVNWALGYFFRGFNWLFERATQAYGKAVGWCLRLSAIVLLVYVGLIGLTGFGFARVPGGFVPSQDKGYLLVNTQLPDSASLERTLEVTEAVERIALDTPGVDHTASIPGQSFVLNAVSSNYGSMFINLKPFDERRGPELSGEAIVARLRERYQREIPEARVLVFGPPAVSGLGNAGGFKLMVQASGDVNFDALQAQADNLAAKGDRRDPVRYRSDAGVLLCCPEAQQASEPHHNNRR